MAEAPPAAPERPARSRWIALLRIAVAAVGLGLFVWTIADAGPQRILEILPRASGWLPVAVALEGVRIGFDAWATRMVLGERGRAIPFAALYGSQVAASGVMGVFPAGRSASEAAKATLLHPWIGAQVAIAMGATNQANVLISSAIFSLVCLAGAMTVSDDTGLAIAIVVHFVVLMAAGLGMRVAATNSHIETLVAKRFPKLGAQARLFHEASRDTPLLAWQPTLAMTIGRAIQTVQYGILAHAVGITVSVPAALAVQGVNLVAAAIGVFVPGQVGTAELVFRMAADALGTDHATAVSIALLARVPQFTWIAIGLFTLLVWRGRRRTGTG
jgi:hypothetical protein